MTSNNLKNIIGKFSEKRVLVVGDVMVDAYFWGKTERISPEAPVPIIEVENTNYNPGGAGNVAYNLATLGADVDLIAVVGNDNNGKILLEQLQSKGINTNNLLMLDGFNTTVKTRVIAQDQQVIRIDQEQNSLDLEKYFTKLKKSLTKNISEIDAIIIADYNKGLLTKNFIDHILITSDENKIPVYVDPKHTHFFDYKCVRLFKPNIAEFKSAMGNYFKNSNIKELGYQFLIDNKLDFLLITRGSKNALLYSKNDIIEIPTVTQSVHDVSGAGDTVIATFALADICGANPQDSANLANIAASIVCSKVGVVPIHSNELHERL